MAVNSTAVWRVRPSGNNTNGGGFDSGIASPGTDRSQQNAAFVTFNGSTTTATTAGVGATITLSGVTGSAADVANCLHITGGTNFLTGWYFITAATASTWTLDRNCTSGAGSAMTGSMGGGWANFWTNTTSSGPLVPGNRVYILGSGVPNPTSYTYDYDMTGVAWTPAAGNATAGNISYANDPSTPSYKAPPDTSGGMPVIKSDNANVTTVNALVFSGLYHVAKSALASGSQVYNGSGSNTLPTVFIGTVWDAFGSDSFFGLAGPGIFLGCEFFSSAAGTFAGNAAIYLGLNSGIYSNIVIGCNFHDLVGAGIVTDTGSSAIIIGNIFAKNGGWGVSMVGVTMPASTWVPTLIYGNTIDGNGLATTSGGLRIATQFNLAIVAVLNNIISNTATGNGFLVAAGTTAANDLIKNFINYNVYYNNTTDVNTISYGVNDTHGGSNPYVNQPVENYTLA